jgi:hypothetical protein
MQQALFHEDLYDALKSAVKCLGGTKAVGIKLWPEKTMSDAQSYLNDCLNKDRLAKLDPQQVLLLMKWAREAGCHEAMNYFCAEAGYSIPLPIEPEDELTKLLREYLATKKKEATLEPRIEELRLKVAK